MDHRRTNKCQESLDLNSDRLKDYKSRLMVFPRRSGTKNVKKGDSTGKKEAQQINDINTLPEAAKAVVMAPITAEMTSFNAHAALRNARNDARMVGIRLKKSKEEKKDEPAAVSKKDDAGDA